MSNPFARFTGTARHVSHGCATKSVQPPATVAPGNVVKLDDGRIGIVDTMRQSPMVGPDGKPEQIDRAYVVGIEKEFADWVVLNEISTVYGQAAKASCTATFTA